MQFTDTSTQSIEDEQKRNVFIRRYWYFDSIEDICEQTGFSRSKVKSMLFEMRRKRAASPCDRVLNMDAIRQPPGKDNQGGCRDS